MASDLSRDDSARLKSLERTIEGGLFAAAYALIEIRDEKLYRGTHGTFEDYCQERWGFTSRRARQLMDAAGVVEDLKNGTIVPLSLPASESVARPLVPLEPEQRRVFWDQAVKASPDGKPTAKVVRAVVHFSKSPPLIQAKYGHVVYQEEPEPPIVIHPIHIEFQASPLELSLPQDVHKLLSKMAAISKQPVAVFACQALGRYLREEAKRLGFKE